METFRSIMSREFFNDVHWLLDPRGCNRLKYNIEWFDPVYSKRDGTTMNVFSCWCEGKTGYPIVDACMRELLTVGFVHFRGRLILAFS